MSEFINPGDLTVERNADGEVLPKEREVGDLGKAEIKPMQYGDVQEYFGDGATADVEAEILAELFRRFYNKPDLNAAAREQGFERCNGNYVESMYPLVPRDLLMALLETSGVDAEVEMQEDNSAQVNVGN